MTEINQAIHNVDVQINEAQQRINDLEQMKKRGEITAQHIFIANAEIRACGKRILNLRIARAKIKAAIA